jgi:Domain of unknown function (DUF4865)
VQALPRLAPDWNDERIREINFTRSLSFIIYLTNPPSMSAYTQILMQYETPLPDDFVMDQVRDRALSVAPKFDEYSGLNFKLYGVNDRSEGAVNEYSSIYLWSDPRAMRGFLEGELFDNYCQVFARPSVRSWLIHETMGDRGVLKESRYCLRQIIPLPRQTQIGEFLKVWTERQSTPEALYRIVGFDPFQWQLIDLTVWQNRPELRDASHRYALVHASVPGD